MNKIKKQPLWKKILDGLKEEIVKKRSRSGDAFYSIREIRNKYQVSSITAKRVLAELENSGWIKKYQGKGSFVSKNAVPLEIKVFLPKDVRDFFIVQRIFSGILEAAKETGTKIFTLSNLSFMDAFKKERYFIVFNELFGWEQFWIPNNKGGSLVIVHTYSLSKKFSSVGADYTLGACLATKHLLSLGHRRIGFITSLGKWLRPRLDGYAKGLRSERIKLDWQMVKDTTGEKREEDWQALEELMALENPPTAIFTGNDCRAYNLLEYCDKHRIRVPEDLSITGFDNVPDSAFCRPPLTTVDTNLFQMGKKAVYLLLDLVNRKTKHRNILVPPTLVTRKSTSILKKGENDEKD